MDMMIMDSLSVDTNDIVTNHHRCFGAYTSHFPPEKYETIIWASR